jgi:hypothetical protein
VCIVFLTNPPIAISSFPIVRVTDYPGVQRFSGVIDLGGDEAEKTSRREHVEFHSHDVIY